MLKKSIFVLIVIFLLISIFANQTVYASELDTIISDADNFIGLGGNDMIDSTGLNSFSDTLYNSLLLIGMVIAVILGTIIGIKFMVSSVEDKAKLKEILIGYVIGCIVLVGAFSIWKIVVVIMS